MDEIHIHGPAPIRGVRSSARAWCLRYGNKVRVRQDIQGHIRVILIGTGGELGRNSERSASRPRLFDLSALAVGESVLLPFIRDAQNNATNARALNAAVIREGKRLGRRFYREGKPRGLRVRRSK